jgi:uncharacterized damage-inducible protein DinB
MNIREVAVSLSAYNRWVNHQIYEAAAVLSDEDRRRELGGAFGSVHGTLQHLIVADRVWLRRFRRQPLTAVTDQDRQVTFEELRVWRLETDSDLEQWAALLDPDFYEQPFSFTSVVYKRARTVPGWAAVLHVFNHQTHHRGQVMTLLRQLGSTVAISADLPWGPYFD